MRVFGVRGAISAETDLPEEIVSKTTEMVSAVIRENAIPLKRIISIQFTITGDLQSLNPAAALRKGRGDLTQVPLFVAQEPVTSDSMVKMIRILLYFRAPFWHKNKPQYLGRAKNLRPDLTEL